MPDEKRIIDLEGWFNCDGTFSPNKRREIIDRVWNLISFPNDPEIREKFFTEVGGMECEAEYLKLKERGHRNRFNAGKAGSMLADILNFNATRPEANFGLNSAIKVMLRRPNFKTIMVDGKKKKIPIPPKQKLSRRTLLNYWEDFRCVAHLYAALFHHKIVEGHKKTVAKRRPNYDSFKPENFLDFMGLAKQIQDFAVNHKSARAREPLISKDEIWWIEPAFELPSSETRHPKENPRWVSKASRE